MTEEIKICENCIYQSGNASYCEFSQSSGIRANHRACDRWKYDEETWGTMEEFVGYWFEKNLPVDLIGKFREEHAALIKQKKEEEYAKLPKGDPTPYFNAIMGKELYTALGTQPADTDAETKKKIDGFYNMLNEEANRIRKEKGE